MIFNLPRVSATLVLLWNAIGSLTFAYGSGTGTVADPTYQHIGIYNIDFSPVPEINPAWGAFLACAIAIGLSLKRGQKSRRDNWANK